MIRVNLLVEGQTEEAFVRELLMPHYSRSGIFLYPIIVRTSPGNRGGIFSYAKVKPQLIRLCKQDRTAYVSTLFDLYALPDDFPGKIDRHYPSNGSGTHKATYLESQMEKDINQINFIPNLLVHEFEALLFTDLEKFGLWTDEKEVIVRLKAAIDQVEGPEDINDDPTTAPSKRISRAMPAFQKTLHGPLIALDIGLDAMRLRCPHFNAWLTRLESLHTT